MCRSASVRIVLAALLLVLVSPLSIAAAPLANEAFQEVWERTERPVTDRVETRTWMWGPTGVTGPMSEPYVEAPDGYREVQYFDKTRMEINDPGADRDSVWYVTNGLLAWEMIHGRIQVGHLEYVDVEPATNQVAGDRHPDSPTYQTLSNLVDAEPREEGETIIERLAVVGEGYALEDDADLSEYDVEVAQFIRETNHSIAEPFWEFMNSTGIVRTDGMNVEGRLFEDPFFATGLPITEAYWVHVPVGGEFRDVLLQCFERRCLTYTPDNPEEWRVEAGNIGRHYHMFRYGRPPEVLDCVELNVATHEELTRITNIGEVRARAVMENRPFAEIDDLDRVPGIGTVTIERIMDEGLACVVYEFETGNDFHHSR